jgi:hypothetical protein
VGAVVDIDRICEIHGVISLLVAADGKQNRETSGSDHPRESARGVVIH